MRELLTPKQLHRDILKNKITLDEGIKILITILNESEESSRVQVIQVFEKLKPFKGEIYKVLEKSLLSDESELVRFIASKALITIFPEQSIEPIEWAIKHDNSVFFLKRLFDLLGIKPNNLLSGFDSLILERVGDCYKVNLLEAQFVLDAAFLNYCYFSEHLEHLDERDENKEEYEKYIREKYLELNQDSWGGFVSSSLIEKGHIKKLSLIGRNIKSQFKSPEDTTYSIEEIPDSLSLLSELESLQISGFCLNSIPEYINELKSLKYLSFYNNYIRDLSKPEKVAPSVQKLSFYENKKIEKTPGFLWEFANRDSSVKRYVSEGVLPSEASVLALLEILRGGPAGGPVLNANLVIERWRKQAVDELGQVDPIEYVYEDINWYENRLMVYTLNEKGHIDRINSEHPELPKIGLFPEQLCSLTHLTELTLIDQNIKNVPECIGNLINLEKLDLSHNSIKKIPNSIAELKNLSHLDLSYNRIVYIPNSINGLKKLTNLDLSHNIITSIPTSIKDLKYLISLDLSHNEINEIPFSTKDFPHLKQLLLTIKDLNIPYRNIVEYLDFYDFKENLSLRRISEIIIETERKKRAEQEELESKFIKLKELSEIIYPSKEILYLTIKTNRDFEYIILWMLNNNFACTWLDFKKEPLTISPATLSKYLNILIGKRFICKVSKGAYMITKLGKKMFNELEIKK